jgi:hypothetical protein
MPKPRADLQQVVFETDTLQLASNIWCRMLMARSGNILGVCLKQSLFRFVFAGWRCRAREKLLLVRVMASLFNVDSS